MPPQQGTKFPNQQPAGSAAPSSLNASGQALPPTPSPLAIVQPTPPAKNGKVAPPPKGNPNSTQNALLLSEIRDNMVIVNDGSMRAVITCQSINFDLMSDRERESVEYSYQQFLNSLYFPIQILIRSQKVDIGPYIDRLDKIRRDQDNMLLGALMDDYIDFISALSEQTNIMDKSFYIVVPFYPAGDMSSAVNSSKSFITNLFAPQRQQHIRIDEKNFAKAKDEIKNRVSTIINGLTQIGIRSVQLTTKELGELYYNSYNPDTAVREPLGNFEELSAPIVIKGQGSAPQPNLEKDY